MSATLHFLALALQTLLRNRVQTTLAMLGVTVGVGALVTSISLGRGAQEQLREQLLAAGVNMIVVTAGNYQVERPQGSGAAPADHGGIEIDRRPPGHLVAGLERLLKELEVAGRSVPGTAGTLRPAVLQPNESSALRFGSLDRSEGLRLLRAHFEDDPFAEHDHPTAAERLGDSMAGLGAAATLTLEDAEAIRTRIPGVQFAASGVHENARLTRVDDPSRQWFTRMHGTEADLPVIRRGWTWPHGRFLSRREVEDSEQVMVLGRVAADRLFGQGVNPVGETLLLWNQPFEIVGVVDSRSWATQPAPGDDQFDAVYVPVTTVHRLLNLSKLNTVTVTTASAGDTTRIADQIVQLLRERHGITDMMPDDFAVKTQAQQLLGDGLPPDVARIVAGNMQSVDQMTVAELSNSLQRANRTMLILLAGVATVSLLVGGIGVMNLLLLSVTQRTREVGLRMAMGAKRRDIAWQFVVEAVLLCLLGGVLGAMLGAAASAGLEGVFQWSTAISPLSAVLAIAVAAALGVASGLYPARRAAQLDPIGSIHYE